MTGDGDPRTVFQPGSDPEPDRTVFDAGQPAPAAPHPGGIGAGDVLNHMFRVERFIARGGMGEVWEGVNIATDERVAIKVMLPQLAADPNVITLFRREANTLTRLHHEAVVQYRVLAQEPRIGLLYIATEYIEGSSLGDVLATLKPSPADQAALLRRLASGLRAAHALGAIHRDIAPDNVLLGGGSLARAKIIDFGIAKDLDPGTHTVVGDGFAGKLGYVAPEQLGDFDRRLGPWTDVYSLGLVMLAVAAGRDAGMGGSLVDAVDKRRRGPDLSPVPAPLRPVIEGMTRADPKLRFQSMDEVLGALDAAALDTPGPARAVSLGPSTRARPRWLVPAAAAGGVALLAGLGLLIARGGGDDAPAPPPTTVAGARDAAIAAREAVDTALPSVGCTWLRVVDVRRDARALSVRLTGVAGSPAAAQDQIVRALAAQGVGPADLDFSEVSPITPAGCAALDAYRQVRARGGDRLRVPQRSFEMRMQAPGQQYAGRIAANAVVEIAPGAGDFALVGLEPSGRIEMLIHDRAEFTAAAAQSRNGVPIADRGGGRYRLQIDLDHQGWSGLLLMTGRGPFDAGVVAPALGARGPDWRDKLVGLAAERGWEADMIWFKSVDEARD